MPPAKLTALKNEKQKELTGGQSQRQMLERIKVLTETASRSYIEIEPVHIETRSPFKELFPIRKEVLTAIEGSMKKEGFDYSQPVIIWKEENVLVDGHCRLRASMGAGLDVVPAYYQSFHTQEEAVNYAYALQFARRNLTEVDRFDFTETYLNNLGQTKNQSGWKKEYLASMMNVSKSTAQKYITVSKQASSVQKNQIRAGNITVNALYNQLKSNIQDQEKATKSPEKVVKDYPDRESDKDDKSHSDSIILDNDLVQYKITQWMQQIKDDDSQKRYCLYMLIGVQAILPVNNPISESMTTFLNKQGKIP